MLVENDIGARRTKLNTLRALSGKREKRKSSLMNHKDAVALFSASAVNGGIDLLKPIKRVLDRHWYVLGEEVSSFETEFADYVGVKHCVAVANGTDALEIALRSFGVGKGDRVVTVANSGFYSSTAIHLVDACPVYVDVDETTLTMALRAFRDSLQLNPKAVIVTHLYGQMACIGDLVQAARSAGIPIIEDCAQAHGATRDGRKAGSWGDAACFSFYPTKNLGALGDGGAIVTNDDSHAATLRTLRQYGWSTKYQVHTRGGMNSRLDEVQAAVLREKLPHLDASNNARRHIASAYNAAFQGLPLQLPVVGDDYVAHLYVVRIREREAFRGFLKNEGIATDVHYPIPDHLQFAYPDAVVAGSLSVTETSSDSVVSLPCFPGLTQVELDRVIAAVTTYF